MSQKETFMTKEGIELLVYKRRLNGYKQEDVANLIGISPSTYNRKEIGKQDWRNKERITIVKYLKLNDEESKVIFLA